MLIEVKLSLFLESKLGVFKRYLLDPGNFNKVNSLL